MVRLWLVIREPSPLFGGTMISVGLLVPLSAGTARVVTTWVTSLEKNFSSLCDLTISKCQQRGLAIAEIRLTAPRVLIAFEHFARTSSGILSK